MGAENGPSKVRQVTNKISANIAQMYGYFFVTTR